LISITSEVQIVGDFRRECFQLLMKKSSSELFGAAGIASSVGGFHCVASPPAFQIGTDRTHHGILCGPIHDLSGRFLCCGVSVAKPFLHVLA
jgi:hypothetical protein